MLFDLFRKKKNRHLSFAHKLYTKHIFLPYASRIFIHPRYTSDCKHANCFILCPVRKYYIVQIHSNVLACIERRTKKTIIHTHWNLVEAHRVLLALRKKKLRDFLFRNKAPCACKSFTHAINDNGDNDGLSYELHPKEKNKTKIKKSKAKIFQNDHTADKMKEPEIKKKRQTQIIMKQHNKLEYYIFTLKKLSTKQHLSTRWRRQSGV